MWGRTIAVLAALWAVSWGRLRAAVVPAGSAAVPPPRWPTPAAGATWEPEFAAADLRYGLPRGLTSRVAWQESRYDPDAVSPAGAVGIMQIVPRWHPGVDPWDPVASIDYGARYLREMFDRFGAWRLALAAYNAGPAAVTRYGSVPPYPETQRYVTAIAGDLSL